MILTLSNINLLVSNNNDNEQLQSTTVLAPALQMKISVNLFNTKEITFMFKD